MRINRRDFIAGAGAAALSVSVASRVDAAGVRPKNADAYFGPMIEDNGIVFPSTNFSKIDVRWRRQFVPYTSTEPQGTVVVDAGNHFLYVIFENQTALRYGVGVGRDGFRWYGRARIDRKQLWPRWTPPPAMRARHPELPEYMDGGKANPLGPRAMYLFRNGKDLGYRIHGTVEPWSIGTNASSGCIRMFNEDAIDLYQRCPIGTRVLVLKALGVPVINESAEVDG
ncbi:MAG: L,D-transpeptidase [Hyphomicrobiales bacterium]